MNEKVTIELNGVLSFATVNDKKPSFLTAIQMSQSQTIAVSLDNVTKADSAGLALMIAGVRFAKKCGKSLSYYKVPTHLLALASFCQLDFIIEKESLGSAIETSEIC